jgi:hypothetical protein
LLYNNDSTCRVQTVSASDSCQLVRSGSMALDKHDGDVAWKGKLSSSRELRWRHSLGDANAEAIGDGKQAALGWKSVPHDQRISLGSVRWMPWKIPGNSPEKPFSPPVIPPANAIYFRPFTGLSPRKWMDGFGRRTSTSHGVVVCEGRAFSRKFRDDLWQKTVPQNILCVDDGIRPSLIVLDLDLLLQPKIDDLEAPPQSWDPVENCIIAGNQRIRLVSPDLN